MKFVPVPPIFVKPVHKSIRLIAYQMNKIKIERNNKKERKKEKKISHHYTDKTCSYWFKYLFQKKKEKKEKNWK